MMRVISRVAFAGMVVGLAGWVSAQGLGENYLPINLSVTNAMQEELDNIEPVGSEIWQFSADTGYCMYEEESYSIDLGMSADIFVLDLADAPAFLEDITTYSFRLPVTASYTGFEDWTLALTASPGLFWDFQGMDSEDLRMEYRGTVTYQVNEALSLMAGADYERYFDANRATPVLGINWQILEELNLVATLTDAKTSCRVDAKLTLQASECVNVFAMMATAGDQWNLEIEGADYDFFYQATRCGVGVEIGVAPNVWLTVMGGIETDRDAQIQSDGNWVLDDDMHDGAFATIGLTFK